MTCDPYWLDVSLLLTCDGTNGSTSFPDSSPNNYPMSAGGVTAVDTSDPMFGTGAMNLGISNTQSAGITTAITAGGPLDMGAGDFTIEGWLNHGDTGTSTRALLSTFSLSSYGGITVYNDASLPNRIALQVVIAAVQYSVFSPQYTPVVGNWHSWAVVRQGTNIAAFFDGVPGMTVAIPAGAVATDLTLGVGRQPYTEFCFHGELDEIRLTKGVARHTPGISYTPAVAAFGTGICLDTVPNVLGDDLTTATAAIVAAGLVLGTVGYTPDVAPVGTVISQNPVGGTSVSPNSAVNLILSSGLDTVPDLTGLTLATATAALIAAGLTVGTVGYILSAALAGTVIDQTPIAGSLALPGAPVSFDIALNNGPPPVFLNDELIFGAYFGGQLNLVEFTYMPGRTPFEEGATNLIINRYKQEPTDTRQRGVDFTPFVVPGETLQSVVVSGISAQRVPQANTNPLVTPLVITNVVIDAVTNLKFAFTVSGGQDGIEYTIQFTCKTNIQSQTLEEIFSINILVEDSFP
jgi:hypothetical protein